MHAVASKSIDFQPKIPARIRDGKREVKKKSMTMKTIESTITSSWGNK